VLQFLSFTRTCHFKKEILNQELYYTFRFPLVDFAKQIDLHPLSTYQRKKLLEFFYQLQGFPNIFNWFSDLEFRSILLFPVIRIENKTSKHTKLIIHITISESFYNIQYPFHFPKTFYTFENKYDFRLKFLIIQSIAHQLSIEKVIYLDDLFNSLSNQNKTYMKTNLIQQFQYLIDGKFIHDKIYLLQNDNQIIQVNKLTRKYIHSTKQLIFYENI
jgi:hypothetical protein